MSRLQVANELGVVEGTLRAAEERGDVPRYSEATRSTYRDFAYVWLAARDGGATPEAIRRVMGTFGGKSEEEKMPQDSVYSPWRTFTLVEPDGSLVRDEKRRCQLLLPHFLRGIGHAVAIPRGSASDFDLPAAAKDSDWWGGDSNGQWYGDEANRYGLIHSRIDAPVAVRDGRKGGSK